MYFCQSFEHHSICKTTMEASVIISPAEIMLRQCLLSMKFIFPTTHPQYHIVKCPHPSESELVSLTGFPHCFYTIKHIYVETLFMREIIIRLANSLTS